MAAEGENETLPTTTPTSTTPVPEEDKPKEITKRSLRLDIWQKMREMKLSPLRRFSIFNKIPNFTGADEAAEKLAQTEEFKKANTIKVNIDLAQQHVKLEVLKAGKTLLVPPAQQSPNVYAKIKCSNMSELDAATQKKIIKLQGPPDTFEEIGMTGTEKIDMVVVGSCAVSRQGYRIGKGNGYVDLDIAILNELGLITKDTLIVTTVHDVQVFDTLPEELFKNYDLPLDLIVTPTEVIRVEKKLRRSTGIQWHLLSSRRLDIVPVLKCMKEDQEKAGKVIELKSDDTDVESFRQKANQRRTLRQSQSTQKRRRRSSRRVDPNLYNDRTGNHDDAGDKTDGETADEGKAVRKRPQRRWNYQRNRSGKRTNKDGTAADSGTEKSEGEENRKKAGKGGDRKRSGRARDSAEKGAKSERKENRGQRSVCIRVSNINRTMRIKELKQELRSRDCNPYFIKWNGFHGRCYLHFARKPDQSDDVTAAALMKRLEDLTLTLPPKEEKDGDNDNDEPRAVKLKCEIFKRKEVVNGEDTQGETEPTQQPTTNGTVLEGSRIETTDVTAV
ncbi:uncharacterized protein LOC129768246 [Toxorhynchites rutilus septentrionalis]|uniref:uncharacterized protein LOC129768246 n=1 Tax=Toxorhynchites rutilus septentrionalis TaxID=329112 RepID=UPI00247A8B0D|nr:uncharacterized protein LOC129768246 [Toxorhynchites rutilus septentrionalis]XP_055625739.1 uncharacterized protein LOC129768246 [Toxorhynchites rutilus septentrionalis]XP_055625746.1 uncharacterized protein LOC129768246 [Toxorhynchites rutilus septentrionalis]